MTREEIEQLYVEEPNCFETDREEQWYKVGLKEGLAAADSHPQWIPVEEKPQEKGWYLVATPTLNSKIDVALWDGKWFRLITITHWMPMTPPPQRKEAKNE